MTKDNDYWRWGASNDGTPPSESLPRLAIGEQGTASLLSFLATLCALYWFAFPFVEAASNRLVAWTAFLMVSCLLFRAWLYVWNAVLLVIASYVIAKSVIMITCSL